MDVKFLVVDERIGENFADTINKAAAEVDGEFVDMYATSDDQILCAIIAYRPKQLKPMSKESIISVLRSRARGLDTYASAGRIVKESLVLRECNAQTLEHWIEVYNKYMKGGGYVEAGRDAADGTIINEGKNA